MGLRGPGETKLEMDRFVIRRRIAQIQARPGGGARRTRPGSDSNAPQQGLPTVALVGYTNAGKSTLLNALSGSAIYAANQLFATLDPTTRRVTLPGGTAVPDHRHCGLHPEAPHRPHRGLPRHAGGGAGGRSVGARDRCQSSVTRWIRPALSSARSRRSGRMIYPSSTCSTRSTGFQDPEAACAALCDLPDSVAVSALTGQGLEEVLAEIEAVLERRCAAVRRAPAV